MDSQSNLTSFVIRFFQETYESNDGETNVRWRGKIKHVQGEEENNFTDFSDAVSFIHKYLSMLTYDTLSGVDNMSNEKIINESLKWWGEVANNYSNMIFKTVEKSIQQSENLKEKFYDVSKNTFPTISFTSNNAEIEELKSLIKGLSERVNLLEDEISELKNKNTGA